MGLVGLGFVGAAVCFLCRGAHSEKGSAASRRARHIEEVEACAPIAAADFGSAIVPTSIRSPKGGKAIAGGKAMAGGKALATSNWISARRTDVLAPPLPPPLFRPMKTRVTPPLATAPVGFW